MKKLTNTIRIILFGLMGLLSFSSCQKWLDVQPEDKFTKDQIYNTEAGVLEAYNGLLLKLAADNLYGNKMTLTNLEVMAHRYRITSSTNPLIDFQEFQYTEVSPKVFFSGVWSGLYSTIANINDFTTVLPTVENGMSTHLKQLLIGESIGLRAFLHFDLLRIFGPAYTEESKTLEAIPYVDKLSTEIQPFLSSELVVSKILADITTAKQILSAEDVKSLADSMSYKNNRFNYYAVVALEARVQQWAGNKEAALAAAQEVIDAEDNFPWITHQKITANGANPDRKFFTEVIFSIFNNKLYDVQKEKFDSNLQESDILATGQNNLVNLVYENNVSDYRYTYSWPEATTGVAYRTFVKYQDITDKTITSRYMVPLIRISEMYYIAAESTTDQAQALSYLNTVRNHRNLSANITDYAQFENELTKEYMKEFYGEGQLWYFYKRKQKTNIFSVNTGDNKLNVTNAAYSVAIPEEETNGR